MEKRGPKGLMILAIFALTLAVSASAMATGPDLTVAGAAAKKKCKKRHHPKKKRCMRKKRRMDAPRLPVVRATLTWSNGAADDVDMDLFVFDSSGGVAGDGSDTIPFSSLSADVSGRAGSETFTDGLFTPQAARDLSFGVCYRVGGSVHTSFTLTYVTADGAIHGDSQDPGGSFRFDYPGGVPIPNSFCVLR